LLIAPNKSSRNTCAAASQRCAKVAASRSEPTVRQRTFSVATALFQRTESMTSGASIFRALPAAWIPARRATRVEPVVAACAARDLACGRRTAGGRAPVLVLDTMGELARTYSVADVAYVGGGLTPDVGLHSLLEPLVAGVPVVFGPHFGKARKIAAEVRASGAGVEVADGKALRDALARLLHGGDEVAAMRRAGRAVLDRHRGAAEEQAEAIAGLLS